MKYTYTIQMPCYTCSLHSPSHIIPRRSHVIALWPKIARQAKIKNIRRLPILLAKAHDDILHFQIPMHDILRVQHLHAGNQLVREHERRLEREAVPAASEQTPQ